MIIKARVRAKVKASLRMAKEEIVLGKTIDLPVHLRRSNKHLAIYGTPEDVQRVKKNAIGNTDHGLKKRSKNMNKELKALRNQRQPF